MMSAICPQCGAAISALAVGCPECLKRVALREAAEPAEGASAVDDLLPESAQRKPSGVANVAAATGASAGSRWGDYQLLEPIGRGAMGTVFKARHVRLNRLAALKLIGHGRHASESERKRFLREAEAVARLQHPHIVTLYETGEAEGQPFLAMEYLPGQTLAESIGEKPLPSRQAAECVKKISEAVQYAHEHGVLHRDLKPSNVVLDPAGEPHVMDFGLARLVEQDSEMTLTGMAIGTPSYMAPEQAAGKVHQVSATSDVYALGAILYETLTARPPFQAESSVETMRQVVEKDPVSPRLLNASVPPDLETICLKCLEKEPRRRYTTAQDLAEELGRFVRDEPISARPVGATEKAWRWCRRNPALASTIGLVLVLLLVVVVGSPIALFRINHERRRTEQHASLEEAQRRRADAQARAASEQRDFALRQLSRADAINDLNTFLLSDADPGKAFTVGELLARAESVVAKEADDAAENRIELFIAIGHQYEELDQHGKARELLGKAYELSRKSTEPSIRAKAAAALSVTVALAGECERGEALIQEAMRELGDAPQFVLHRVFVALRGCRVARECGREQLGIERVQEAGRMLKASGQKSELLHLNIAMDLAEAYRMAGKYGEAADAFSVAFEQLSALGRAETGKASTLLNNWALALDLLGRSLEAERRYRQAISISRAGGTNMESVSPMLLINYARALTEINQLDEAAAVAEQALEKAKRAGDEHVVNMSLSQLSTTYRKQGKLDRAGEMLAAFEEKTKKLLPSEHPVFAIIASHKALLALARGEMETARLEADRCIELAEKTPGMPLSFLLLRRAEVHSKSRRHDAARADAIRVLGLEQTVGGGGGHTSASGFAHLIIARAFSEQGKTAEARTNYAAALQHLRPCLGEDHPETLEAARNVSNP